MNKLFVERNWSKHIKGQRTKGRYVGYSCTLGPNASSSSLWHKKMFKHRWLKYMILHAASMKLEYGFHNIAWAKRADFRFREQHIKECPYNRISK